MSMFNQRVSNLAPLPANESTCQATLLILSFALYEPLAEVKKGGGGQIAPCQHCNRCNQPLEPYRALFRPQVDELSPQASDACNPGMCSLPKGVSPWLMELA